MNIDVNISKEDNQLSGTTIHLSSELKQKLFNELKNKNTPIRIINSKNLREITAIHEAGHAVMAVKRGAIIEKIEIFNNQAEGGIKLNPKPIDGLLSGIIAQYLLTSHAKMDDWINDSECDKLSDGDSNYFFVFKRCVKRIKKESTIQESIIKVADELHEKGTLKGERVHEIIEHFEKQNPTNN